MNSKCNLCPHKCNVDRSSVRGRCSASNKIKVGLASLHYFEEPCISGKSGSGTVFFTHCNLKCVYCQNFKISRDGFGKEISVEELANTFLSLQEKGANNINLVTPTVYVDKIIEAIKIARNNGLNIPIIYNSSGYENVSTIEKLNGYIDIYLPDFKYAFDDLAMKYSKVPNYSSTAKKAIIAMYKQVGKPVFNEDGMLVKGVDIRHLILPENIENSKAVLKWIKDTFNDNVLVSIMAQYFPTNKAYEFEELNRKLTKEEYREIEAYIDKIGLENGFIQELGEHEEEYVPNFDLSGIE